MHGPSPLTNSPSLLPRSSPVPAPLSPAGAGRHLPVARPGVASSDAPGAQPPGLGLELPSQLPQLPSDMFGPKEVAQLLEQLSSDLRAGAAAAAADQQQQQDQDSRGGQPGSSGAEQGGGELGECQHPRVGCCGGA